MRALEIRSDLMICAHDTTELFTFTCYTSHTKYVSNEQGVSFHLRPFPSLFHSSRQCSSSPFSYRKLLGSPVFQLVNVTGRPVAIQKNEPSSAWSVPEVQKCSLPRPEIKSFQYLGIIMQKQVCKYVVNLLSAGKFFSPAKQMNTCVHK